MCNYNFNLIVSHTSQEEHSKNEQANDFSSQNEKVDATLLFMTMQVTMTEHNEMPMVSPYKGPLPTDILGFYRVKSTTVKTVAPHFFFDDYDIRRFWRKPFLTEHKLEHFDCSISMDFSMTAEMSRPQKIYSSFLNKLWAAWLQSRGHQVIPNVSFPDEYWEDYWLEGWPKHSVIAVSSVGVLRHGNPDVWLKGFKRIQDILQPIHIIRYGSMIPGEDGVNCTYFTNDNNRAANGSK